MIKFITKSFKQYLREWSEADLLGFNKFLIRNVLLHLFKLDNILPIIIGILLLVSGVLLLGITSESQRSVYIFIPQSNITVFISFVLLQFAIALLMLLICPFIIILTFNHIGYKLPHIIPKVFLPIKLVLLILTFYTCLNFVTSEAFKMNDKLLIIFLWSALYFFLMNLYLAQKHHQNPFRLTTFRIIFAIFFILIIIKPFSTILYRTSEIINYVEINPSIYLNNINCKLIAKPHHEVIESQNLSINNPQYVELTNDGCYLKGNLIRIGFASDYAIIFKQNILPIQEKEANYNYYAHLSCYSGNCFVEHTKANTKHDIDAAMLIDSH